MSDARIPERKPGTTPAGTRPGGSGAEDPTTLSPSGVFTAPPPTAAAGSPSTISPSGVFTAPPPTAAAGSPSTMSPSGVFTAPPSTVGAAAGGPASSRAAGPYERVMEPTPPLPDVRAETDVPRSSPRWQGLAAGIVAAVVLAVLAWLALVPWLRNRTPAAEPKVAAAAAPTPTPTRTPTAIPTPVPAQVAIPAAAPTPTPTASSAGTVEVRRGDTLWHLSAVHLGDPLRWPDLHHANRARIANPDLIFPGQVLHVPSR